jgi:predicted ATPase
MASLALPSLQVQGFRGFQNLQIEKLGRVNLIVGKNNIGKSSLLEAIQLYAATDLPRSLWQVLAAHGENRGRKVESALSSVKYLFFGRKDITGPTDPIKIGPIDNPEQQLRISINFYAPKVDEEGVRTFKILSPEEYDTAENLTPRFSIRIGNTFRKSYSLDPAVRPKLSRTEIKGIKVVSVGANGLNEREIAQLWDNVTLTDYEQDVLKALRIVAPGIEAINITSMHDHIPIVKVQGMTEPFLIRSLGDGMQRMLGIALALVNAQIGFLLIDEVENGLHYSVQEDLWKLVFQIAHQLNVQIFATTHSWDCITAFQQAVQDEESEEGVLIRLEYKKDDIVATLFDKRKLAIATRSHIEVR